MEKIRRNFIFLIFATTANMIALQGAIFHLKAQIAFKLQDLAYQTADLIAFRKALVDDMVRKVQQLNKDNFAVRQHLKYVELYANADNYAALTYEDTLLMGQELAPLITPEEDDPKAMRFDAKGCCRCICCKHSGNHGTI